MTEQKQITLEEALRLVEFECVQGEWQVLRVHSTINGDVWGDVRGGVYGTINGREWQFIFPRNPKGKT